MPDKDADQADVSRVTRGAQGLRQRARSADFQRQVDAAPAGHFQDALFPFRLGAVIDRVCAPIARARLVCRRCWKSG